MYFHQIECLRDSAYLRIPIKICIQVRMAPLTNKASIHRTRDGCWISQEPVFSSSSSFFLKNLRFAFVVLGCISWSWSEKQNVRARKSSAALSELPSSESTPLINHFSSEKSSGTVTDSKISQEKKSPHDWWNHASKRGQHECNAGWMRKSWRSARCLARKKLIFQPSADWSRLLSTNESLVFSSTSDRSF